jgi:hypothetical protein
MTLIAKRQRPSEVDFSRSAAVRAAPGMPRADLSYVPLTMFSATQASPSAAVKKCRQANVLELQIPHGGPAGGKGPPLISPDGHWSGNSLRQPQPIH